MRGSETSRRIVRSRGLLVGVSVGVFAVIAGLSGCAPATPVHSPTPSHITRPPSTPTPAPIVAPSMAFQGNCDSVLSAATVKTITGAALALQPSDLRMWPYEGSGGSDAVAMRGGVDCSWEEPTAIHTPTLSVIALSAKSGITLPVASQDCTTSTGTSVSGPTINCGGSLTDTGYWIDWGLEGLTNTSQTAANNEAGALVGALEAGAAQAGPAATFVQPSGSRSDPIDCAQLATATGLPSKLAVPGLALAPQTTDSLPGVIGHIIANVAATSCTWDIPDYAGDGSSEPGFTVTVYPGAAWYLATYRSAIDADVVSISGVGDAVEIDPHPGEDFERIGDVLAVAQGVDLVTIGWQNINFTNKSPVIPSVLAALKRQP